MWSDVSTQRRRGGKNAKRIGGLNLFEKGHLLAGAAVAAYLCKTLDPCLRRDDANSPNTSWARSCLRRQASSGWAFVAKPAPTCTNLRSVITDNPLCVLCASALENLQSLKRPIIPPEHMPFRTHELDIGARRRYAELLLDEAAQCFRVGRGLGLGQPQAL